MPSGEPEPMNCPILARPARVTMMAPDQTSINVDAFVVVHMVKPGD